MLVHSMEVLQWGTLRKLGRTLGNLCKGYDLVFQMYNHHHHHHNSLLVL